MEEEKSKVEELIEHVEEYVNIQTELITLKTTDKIAGMLSSSIVIMILIIIFLIFLIFANLAIAYIISGMIGKPYSGFLIIAGFYLLIGLFLWAGKDKWLKEPILNKIIKQAFKERNEEQD